jgi:hypothetical protein
MAQRRVSSRGPVAESSGLGGGSEVKGSLVFHVAWNILKDYYHTKRQYHNTAKNISESQSRSLHQKDARTKQATRSPIPTLADTHA